MTQHAFYVVTKPTPHSTLEDICFKTYASHLVLQAMGGLRPDEIVFAGLDGLEAEAIARAAIAKGDADSGIGERMDDSIASENEEAQEAQDSAEELGYGDEITTDEGEV